MELVNRKKSGATLDVQIEGWGQQPACPTLLEETGRKESEVRRRSSACARVSTCGGEDRRSVQGFEEESMSSPVQGLRIWIEGADAASNP